MCLWFGAKRDGLCPISLRADNLDNDPTHLKVPRVFFAAWLSSVISVKSRREFEWAGENGKKQKKNSWFSLSKLPHINMGDASRWQKQFRWDHRVELKQTQSLIALPLVEWRMSLWREMANEKTCKCWKDLKCNRMRWGGFEMEKDGVLDEIKDFGNFCASLFYQILEGQWDRPSVWENQFSSPVRILMEKSDCRLPSLDL